MCENVSLKSQLPARGVPKIPTANSIQTKTSTTKTAIAATILYLVCLIFLARKSIKSPVANNNAPAITKSEVLQFTSSVNCIAMMGVNSRMAIVIKMANCDLLIIIMGFTIY